MWHLPLLPKIQYETIGLCFTPTTLIISWVQRHTGTRPYLLKAYKEIALSPSTLCKDRVCNPTSLQRHIRSFIRTYALENAYTLCAINGPGIQEKIAAQPPPEHHITSDHNVWFRQYLYTLDNADKIFYQVGITHTLLLQYVLLALQADLNLVALIPHFTPYLALYQRIHAPAFRRTQLAQDMQQHHNQLPTMITHEHTQRLITVPTHIHHVTSHGIPLAVGLFLLGADHEAYQFH